MGDRSAIEWTDASWNPTTGCTKVSPGCDHCYAIRAGARLQHLPAYEGTVADGDWTGRVNVVPGRLDQPLRWKRPRRIFVDSMSDLFHPDVPDGFVADVFGVMAVAGLSAGHTFQVLTKRPQRMAKLLSGAVGGYYSPRSYVSPSNGMPVNYANARGAIAGCAHRWAIDRVNAGALSDGIDSHYWPLPNVWLGTSIESDRYTFRADHLRATPAAVRFLSLEPLLGPLPSLDLTGIDWVIVGAESGPGARPMNDDWVREIREHCTSLNIPFFLKQQADAAGHKIPLPELDGRQWMAMPLGVA
jgi:protein gp37